MPTEQDWLDSVRALVMRGESASAQTTLARALAEFPGSADLQRIRAGIFQQTGRAVEAEQTLRALLNRNPGDAGSAFALARILQEEGYNAAVAAILRACFAVERNTRDPDLAITAIELLDDIDRKRDAAAIAEAALAEHPDDARLHAYAGMLAIQAGEFEHARAHYLFALQRDPRAFEWHVPIGLSSTLRYADPVHPDFALFRDGLGRDGLSGLARAELHFSLGKAHDDIGDYARAAQHYREGNAIRHRLTQWSRKTWRRVVEARLAAKPTSVAMAPREGFTPVFIVGMPRTGTTLLAELLSRHPGALNRGELAELAHLAQEPAMSGVPDRTVIERAMIRYARRSRQDDAAESQWFIDKQPLNFRFIDLALTMFPAARVVHCQRNPRDTALSLWAQCFLEDVQGYAYDFGDITLVMRDCERLMAHWTLLYPNSIRAVHYEDVIANPGAAVAELARWIGMPPLPQDGSNVTAQSNGTISTASLWQARQPIHPRSMERWKHYAVYIPELLKLPER